MNFGNPLSRKDFGSMGGTSMCEYHGIDHSHVLLWSDVDALFEIDSSTSVDDQYLQYLAYCKIANTPLGKALR